MSADSLDPHSSDNGAARSSARSISLRPALAPAFSGTSVLEAVSRESFRVAFNQLLFKPPGPCSRVTYCYERTPTESPSDKAMIKTLATFILLSLLLPLSAQDKSAEQAWKSSDGKIIQAKFVRADTDSVVIERNGQSFTVPFAKLSAESVELAKKLAGDAPSDVSKMPGAAARVESADASATKPSIRFRWLKTDPRTADALVDTLKRSDRGVDALTALISPQIKSGKITDLGSAERDIGEIRSFKIDADAKWLRELEAAEAQRGFRPTEEQIQRYMRTINMEASVFKVFENGLLDFHLDPSWSPNFPEVSGSIDCNSRSLLTSEHWSLKARWGDDKAHILLLCCRSPGSSCPKPLNDQGAQATSTGKPKGLVIHLDVEWREMSVAHFAELVEIPPNERDVRSGRLGRAIRPSSIEPKNSAGAVAWLQPRTKLLASFTSACMAGQASAQKLSWGGEPLDSQSKKGASEGTSAAKPLQGVSLSWNAIILSDGIGYNPEAHSVDDGTVGLQTILSCPLLLTLEASFLPLEARSKTEGTDFTIFGVSMQPGVPIIFGPEKVPQNGKPVVLVITPWYESVR